MEKLINVLMVEDDSFWAGEINKSLEPKRFNVFNAKTLSETIDKMNENNFDLIILDLNMPDSTTNNTISAVLSRTKYTPVIILSTISDKTVISRAMSLGVQDFIIKSQFNERDLILSALRAIECIRNKINAEKRNDLESIIEKLESIEKTLNIWKL